jgi:hypothetical protein
MLKILFLCDDRCPILGTKFDFQDVTSQSDWFCFATDDARDTMSMLR